LDRLYIRFLFNHTAATLPAEPCPDVEIPALSIASLRDIDIPADAQSFQILQCKVVDGAENVRPIETARRKGPYYLGRVHTAATLAALPADNPVAVKLKEAFSRMISCYRNCGRCFCGTVPESLVQTQTDDIIPIRGPAKVIDPATKKVIWVAEHGYQGPPRPEMTL